MKFYWINGDHVSLKIVKPLWALKSSHFLLQNSAFLDFYFIVLRSSAMTLYDFCMKCGTKSYSALANNLATSLMNIHISIQPSPKICYLSKRARKLWIVQRSAGTNGVVNVTNNTYLSYFFPFLKKMYGRQLERGSETGYLWLMCGFRFIWCRQTWFWAPGPVRKYTSAQYS